MLFTGWQGKIGSGLQFLPPRALLDGCTLDITTQGDLEEAMAQESQAEVGEEREFLERASK